MRGRLSTRTCVALMVPLLFLIPANPSPGHPGRLGNAGPTVGASLSVGPRVADAVTNFSEAIQRLVTLIGVAGGGLLTLVWVRVALSWFSSDLTKKIQAKDRARDALIGTLIFVAAISGLAWGLAHWVVTGS